MSHNLCAHACKHHHHCPPHCGSMLLHAGLQSAPYRGPQAAAVRLGGGTAAACEGGSKPAAAGARVRAASRILSPQLQLSRGTASSTSTHMLLPSAVIRQRDHLPWSVSSPRGGGGQMATAILGGLPVYRQAGLNAWTRLAQQLWVAMRAWRCCVGCETSREGTSACFQPYAHPRPRHACQRRRRPLAAVLPVLPECR